MRRGLAVALILTFAGVFSVNAYAKSKPRGEPPAISEVKSAYARCQAVRELPTTKRVLLVLIRNQPKEQGHWEVPSPGTEQTADEQMTVYVADEKVIAVDLYDAGLSGDWTQVVTHCFRTDGSLAFLLAVLRTFYGDVKVEDRFYFDHTGKQIRTLRSVFDLSTNKRVHPKKGDFMAHEPQIFHTTDEVLNAIGRGNVFGTRQTK